jgi:hypothetical protein
MDVWDTLVTVLSKNSLATAEGNGGSLITQEFNLATYNDVLSLPGYDAAFTTIKTLKRSIELIEDRQEQAEVEIRRCLRVVADEVEKAGVSAVTKPGRPAPRILAIESFIREGMYKTRWSQKQRDAFDLRVKVITRWIDFFVSYTNRDAGGINTQFEKLIRSVFGCFPTQKERIARNYVARIVVKFLVTNNLRGFADYADIQCGDEIEDKVRDYCQKAFGFVQLVEPESFVEPAAPKINWCYEEYQEFRKERAELSAFQIPAPSKVYVVVSAKELKAVRPANIGGFATWYDGIAPLRHFSLHETDKDQLYEEIKKVAVDLLESKKATVEAVLAA